MFRCSLAAAALGAIAFPAQAASQPARNAATAAVAQDANAQLAGASIESDYVAPRGVPVPRLERLAAREAAQGKYDLDEALRYLKRSSRAAAVIDRIERSGGRISIVVNHQCNDEQRMTGGGNSLVLWDPHCAYHIGAGSDSPSLVLFHELVHTLHLAENPQRYLDDTSRKLADFDTAEERRTILSAEIPVARELGESVRLDHHENRPFRVNDPTVR